MDIQLGVYGIVIALICVVLGLAEVGLWVACYFVCTDGQVIEFNYFAGVWTGGLAFAVGFMILVLACVKFKSLGTFIIIVSFVLVPCAVICACIYGYRAYLARPGDDVRDRSIAEQYFSVIMYSAMGVCGFLLFVTNIAWNCYYCCIATPVEDYEEEVKDAMDDEEEKEKAQQRSPRVEEDRFISNPVTEDDYRSQYPRATPFSDQRNNQQSRDGRYPNFVPTSTHPRTRNAQPSDIREDYPYPEAFTREPYPEQRGRRAPQPITQLPRAHANPVSQSQHVSANTRGYDNRGFQSDIPNGVRPSESHYNHRGYLFDGTQGASYNQTEANYRDNARGYRPNSPERLPNQYGANANNAADHYRQSNGNGRRTNREPRLYGERSDHGSNGVRSQAQEMSSIPEYRSRDTSNVYRPRPENFRGKPAKPDYMAHRPSQRSEYFGGESSQYSAFRNTRAADAYF